MTHLPKDLSDVSIALSREDALANVFVVARLAGIFPLADPVVGKLDIGAGEATSIPARTTCWFMFSSSFYLIFFLIFSSL